jgi:hypothetical protein
METPNGPGTSGASSGMSGTNTMEKSHGMSHKHTRHAHKKSKKDEMNAPTPSSESQ